jgi:hypothetical protein
MMVNKIRSDMNGGLTHCRKRHWHKTMRVAGEVSVTSRRAENGYNKTAAEKKERVKSKPMSKQVCDEVRIIKVTTGERKFDKTVDGRRAELHQVTHKRKRKEAEVEVLLAQEAVLLQQLEDAEDNNHDQHLSSDDSLITDEDVERYYDATTMGTIDHAVPPVSGIPIVETADKAEVVPRSCHDPPRARLSTTMGMIDHAVPPVSGIPIVKTVDKAEVVPRSCHDPPRTRLSTPVKAPIAKTTSAPKTAPNACELDHDQMEEGVVYKGLDDS